MTESQATKVCIVGAGPNGLIMARALLAAGIEFDHYERHTDVGGVWDPDSPAARCTSPRT